MRLPAACCLSLLGLALDASAQTPAKETERTPTLHDAWLYEVLDLDTKKATAAYTKVATDQRPGNLDRWVAVARLAELKRLGIEVTLRTDLRDVPEPLRAPLASIAAPLPVADLLQRVKGVPDEVMKTVGTESGRMPPLHPITLLAEEWKLTQVPSQREQGNRSRPGPGRIAEQPNAWQPEDVRVVRARLIATMELSGLQSRADARRALFFPNWQPPILQGEPQLHLAKIRKNFDEWIVERDITTQQKNMLTQLRDAFIDKATTDPATALALVARLPIFAERLLGLPPAMNR